MDIFIKEQSDSVVRVSMGSDYRPAIVQIFDSQNKARALDFSIIKDVALKSAANYQLSRALRDRIYITSFGGTDTAIVISGLTFGRPACSEGDSQTSGLLDILQAYDGMNISNITESGDVPFVTVALVGDRMYSGFLVSVDVNLKDAPGTPANYQLTIIGATSNKR